jgi:uncharacterized membrane protein SirB2
MLAKNIHVTCVVITISFFIIRGLWVLFDSKLQNQQWPRKLAPVIDTLLLASAITFAVQIQQYPIVNSWLSAKVIGMILYIGLGAVALKYGKTKRIKIMAFAASLFVFAYIVSVALTKNPWVIF